MKADRVARRKGFLAEYNRQVKLAEKRARQKQRAAEQAERTRRLEQKRSAQIQTRIIKASIAEAKALEKERKRLYVEAKILEVENLNCDLQETYQDIDSLLQATLTMDDFVDLEALRKVAVHPPFSEPELESQIHLPQAPALPAEPVWTPPTPATGIKSHFDSLRKQQRRFEQAQIQFQHQHSAWRNQVAYIRQSYEQAVMPYRQAEIERLSNLEKAKDAYSAECQRRDVEVEDWNQDLDALITGLTRKAPSAIQAYVEIVLSNSVYPEAFPVNHTHSFDPETGELVVEVSVPTPESIPAIKAYKYVKSKDSITSVTLPKTAQKERYSGAVAQVAVRTMHEIYEADRQAHIETIALAVSVAHKDPGTGLDSKVSLVGVASERSAFCEFDLESVVPLATLEHLGAEISSNMLALKPISGMGGVRTR